MLLVLDLAAYTTAECEMELLLACRKTTVFNIGNVVLCRKLQERCSSSQSASPNIYSLMDFNGVIDPALYYLRDG